MTEGTYCGIDSVELHGEVKMFETHSNVRADGRVLFRIEIFGAATHDETLKMFAGFKKKSGRVQHDFKTGKTVVRVP